MSVASGDTVAAAAEWFGRATGRATALRFGCDGREQKQSDNYACDLHVLVSCNLPV
jgi:hypothetical protein